MGNAGATQTSQGVEAKAGAAWRPDIQGLRAIAVLVVVAYHADLPLPGGFVGVDIFFVISGYVITAMLQREWDRGQSLDLRRFYFRRFKRLMPALALAVSATAVISIFVLSPFESQTPTALTGIGAMLFSANLVIAKTSGGYFDAPAESNALLNTWSLSVEEQFYLVFPLLLLLGWSVGRRLGRKGIAFAAVAIGGLASFALAVVNSWGWIPPIGGILMGFYGPVTRAWEFAAGALLALGSARGLGGGKSKTLRAAAGFAGLTLVAVSVFAIDPWVPFPGLWTLLPVTATVLVIWGGSATASPASRILASKPLVRVGDWSYSIYLWHWPFIVFAAYIWPANTIALLIAATLSFAPAVASYRWVEQPLRQANIQGKRQVTSLVTLTLIPPLALSAFLALGSNQKWWTNWPQPTLSLGEDRNVAVERCSPSDFAIDNFTPAECWEPEGRQAIGEVLLLGDSQAAAFLTEVIQASARSGLRTLYSAKPGCPFADVRVSGEHIGFNCQDWQDQSLAYALTADPEMVIIANRSTGYTSPDLHWRVPLHESGRPTTTVAEASARYASGLASYVHSLREAGNGVVIIQNVPGPTGVYDQQTLLRKALQPPVPAGFSRQPALEQAEAGRTAELYVSERDSGVALVDSFEVLCPYTSADCPLALDGVSLYLDPAHISAEGAKLLTERLEGAVARLR